MKGINQLITMLKNGTIQGFLIDRNTYYHFTNRIKEKKYAYMAKRVHELDMIKTEKFLNQKDLSSGFLVQDINDFHFFSAYVVNNVLDIDSCNSMRMNVRDRKVKKPSGIFSTDEQLFETFLTYSLCVLSVLIILGLVYECRRYCRGKPD